MQRKVQVQLLSGGRSSENILVVLVQPKVPRNTLTTGRRLRLQQLLPFGKAAVSGFTNSCSEAIKSIAGGKSPVRICASKTRGRQLRRTLVDIRGKRGAGAILGTSPRGGTSRRDPLQLHASKTTAAKLGVYCTRGCSWQAWRVGGSPRPVPVIPPRRGIGGKHKLEEGNETSVGTSRRITGCCSLDRLSPKFVQTCSTRTSLSRPLVGLAEGGRACAKK